MNALTEERIAALAPDTATLENGRLIARNGEFIRLERSADGLFYRGEWFNSASRSCMTSADFSAGATPVLRCTCPSRRMPCKHCLGLLFEMLDGKPFEDMEIPRDMLLEGLARTEALVLGIVDGGLGRLRGAALDGCRKLAQELENYYLSGPRRLLRRLVQEAETREAGTDVQSTARLLATLETLWAMVRKSRQYLEAGGSGATAGELSPLYEELGGAWRLSDLERQGQVRKDARLVQLAFWINKDDAREEYVDMACWADLDRGDIVVTRSYRPFLLKGYLTTGDSIFGVAQVPKAICCPSEGNTLVRWEEADIRPVSQADRQRLRELAAPALAPEIRAARNLLKNPLAEPPLFRLLRFARIGRAGESFVLVDPQGDTILLEDMPGLEGSMPRLHDGSTIWLPLLPDAALWENQCLLGAIWHDAAAGRMKMQPLSIVSDAAIVRLLY